MKSLLPSAGLKGALLKGAGVLALAATLTACSQNPTPLDRPDDVPATFEQTAVVLVIVSVVTIPAAVMLARYQARRTVWEQEIRDSERAAEHSRRQLVAFVSHDLRTPLAGIRAVSEAIADGVVTDDEVRTQAKHIEQESIRLSEMVDDLFEMSKINAGSVQPVREQRV